MKTGLILSLHGRPFSAQRMAFYRQNPNHQDPGEIGGADAPPNSPTLPRKRGFGRVSTARVWPGGHTLLVSLPGFAFWLYLQLDFQFESGVVTKWPLIFASTDRFWEDSSQPVFNLSDFALIHCCLLYTSPSPRDS